MNSFHHSLYPYDGASGDWVPVTHPGGALYFYHRILVRQQLFCYPPSELGLEEDFH
jgi:hypothetical protein